jgi:hypothetical protein
MVSGATAHGIAPQGGGVTAGHLLLTHVITAGHRRRLVHEMTVGRLRLVPGVTAGHRRRRHHHLLCGI